MAAVVMGGLALLAAPLAGLRAFLQPLRGARDTPKAGRWVRVTRASSLPPDGVPRRFPVIADHLNAWTRVPAVPIGAVYLRRAADDLSQVQALSVVCPHAGCSVDYGASVGSFLCPCHNSRFTLEGAVENPTSPSPRGLDPLEVEVRNGEEIWVRYQVFRPGIEERKPLA